MCPIADRLIVGVDLSPKMAELAAELVVDDSLTPMTKDLMRRLAAELALAYLSCCVAWKLISAARRQLQLVNINTLVTFRLVNEYDKNETNEGTDITTKCRYRQAV